MSYEYPILAPNGDLLGRITLAADIVADMEKNFPNVALRPTILCGRNAAGEEDRTVVSFMPEFDLNLGSEAEKDA